MKNKDIIQAYGQIMTDILNKNITSKESRQRTKEIDKHSRILRSRLKNTKTWNAIALTRNELITHIVDNQNVWLVPISSLEFYPELDKYQDFNITLDGVEYCCIMGNV